MRIFGESGDTVVCGTRHRAYTSTAHLRVQFSLALLVEYLCHCVFVFIYWTPFVYYTLRPGGLLSRL